MKRIIAFIITIAVVLSLAPGAFAAEGAAVSEENQRAAELLQHLGVIADVSQEGGLSGVVTRGELTAILLRLSGVDASEWPSESVFDDVPLSHTYGREINAACRMGLVSGKAPGLFAPDAPVVYEEAAALLIKTLGFAPLAENKGGYPTGYLSLAQQKRILDGVSAVRGEIIRAHAVYRMIYNALETEMFVENAVAPNRIDGTLSKDQTLLTKGLKIAHRTGIVEANDTSFLTEVDGVGEGMVRISGLDYEEAGTGAFAYLGYLVDYYVDISDEAAQIKPLKYICAHRRNEAICVDARDLLPKDSDFSKRRLVYEVEGRRCTKEISPYADFLYNGVWKSCSAEDMATVNGAVTLIDNDADGAADVVSIMDYKTIVVGGAAPESGAVYDKYSDEGVVLDATKKDKVVILTNGRTDSFSSIREWSVLSVAESQNAAGRKCVTVLHSKNYAEGTLTGMDEEHIWIGEEEYRIAPGAESRLKEAIIGTEGRWYLDAFGNAAAFEAADAYQTSMDYAYLIAVHVSKTLEKTCSLKILKTDGTVAVHDVAERVGVDGARAAAADGDALSSVLLEAGQGKYQQVIRCGFDRNEKINRIDTLRQGAGGECDTLSRDYVPDPAAANLPRYSQYAGGFGVQTLQVMIDAETKVFNVPAADGTQRDKDYGVRNAGDFSHLGEYKLEGYDLSATKVAGLLVVQGTQGGGSLSRQPEPALVTSVGRALSEEGEEKTSVKMWYQGAMRTYLLESEEVLADVQPVAGKRLEAGDVIVFALRDNGEITNLKKFYNCKTEKFGYVDYTYGQLYTNDWWYYANLRLTLGRLIAKEGDSILVSYGDDLQDTSKQEPKLLKASGRCCVYSVKKDKVSAIPKEELDAYTYGRNPNVRILIASASGTPYDVFVIDLEN